MHAALAALLLSALAAVASGQPYMDKQTVATADPVGAQVFVERYMGFYRRHFTFESAEAGECANITWNTLCPDWRELSTTVQMQRSRSYNWEWQIHFVHNKVLPSGPMAFGDAYGHIAEKIAPMRKWEPFMQASQSGYLVRDLTDLVRKLKTDGVPVWLTYRRDDDPASSDFLAAWAAGDDHTAPAPVFRPTATDAVPSAAVHAEIQHRREREGRATEDAAPEGFLSRWASSLSRWASYLFGRNKQTATGRRTTTVFGPGGQYDGRDGQHALPQGFNRPRPAERRPPTTLGHGEEKRARNQPWTHQFDKPKAGDVLYTAWVAVPGGVTYTFASFRLDAALAKGAVPFKRPCDGPVAYVHRMLADEGLDGRHEKFWDTVPFPNAHDYLPYYTVVPSFAPRANAEQLAYLSNRKQRSTTGARHPQNHPARVKRSNAECAVVGMPGSVHETRFEIVDDAPATDGSGFSVADFVRYRAALHASVEWGEQNAYMDEHLGLYSLVMQEPGPEEAPGNNSQWASLLRHIDRLKQPYLTRGRNQFESVLIASPDKTAIVQVLAINTVRRSEPEQFDMPLPGCNEMAPWDTKRYHNHVMAGMTDAEHLAYRKRVQYMPKRAAHITDAHLQPLSDRFKLCAVPSARFRDFFANTFTCRAHEGRRLCRVADEKFADGLFYPELNIGRVAVHERGVRPTRAEGSEARNGPRSHRGPAGGARHEKKGHPQLGP